jgi:hypothetical protein
MNCVFNSRRQFSCEQNTLFIEVRLTILVKSSKRIGSNTDNPIWYCDVAILLDAERLQHPTMSLVLDRNVIASR